MNNKQSARHVGQGMVIGILISTLIALIVNLITGDSSVWTYMIPIGVAMGAAIGAGQAKQAAPDGEES